MKAHIPLLFLSRLKRQLSSCVTTNRPRISAAATIHGELAIVRMAVMWLIVVVHDGNQVPRELFV